MLEQVGKINALSPKLRDELNRLQSEAGNSVKYRVMIEKNNPDPEKYNGNTIFPKSYLLRPVTYDIVDPHDKQRKKIGLVSLLDDKGEAAGFKRIHLTSRQRGEIELDLTNPDHLDTFAWIEFNPGYENSPFKKGKTIIKRVDRVKESKQRLSKHNVKADAMYYAAGMSDTEVKDFACAMGDGWNEHEDIDVLKDRIGLLAEETPDFFTVLVNDKTGIGYRATTKRAMDKGVILWIPVESKFVWGDTKQVLAVLERADGDAIARMADWLATSKNGKEVYEKLRKLIEK